MGQAVGGMYLVETPEDVAKLQVQHEDNLAFVTQTTLSVDDAAKIEQEYIVEVRGDIIPDGLQLLNHGLKFSGKPLPPVKISWQNETRLRFPLKAPPRGLIAHMCEKVGLEIVSMKRIRLGRVPMAGLPAGQWRYLLGYERF